MKKVKMIGFDLDGTLLTTEKKLTVHTREVLLEAVRRGIEILPATGRPLSGLPAEVRTFPGVRYAVTSNGARIVEAESQETLYANLMPPDKARELMKIFSEYDTMREIYYDGTGYSDTEKMNNIRHYVSDPAMINYILNSRVAIADIDEKFRQENRPVDKVHALFANLKEREEALERVKKIPGVEVTGALVNNIEVNAEGVNKGEALLRLGEKLGIDREEIAAFGDGANDRAMLQAVGVGVAMANAIPEVKEAAKYMTVSNDEEGVAAFIERYILA